MRQSRAVVVMGIALGLIGGVFLATAMSGQLYGVHPLDPSTHLSLALLTAAVAAAAICIPCRKARHTDPVPLLRGE